MHVASIFLTQTSTIFIISICSGTSQGIGGQGTFSPFVPGGGGGFGAPTGFGKRRRRRSVDDEIDFGEDYPTYNQNTFPTPSNITEAEAIGECSTWGMY